MDIKVYLKEFKSLPGVSTVGVIERLHDPNYHVESDQEKDVNWLRNLVLNISTKIFDLSIEKFFFRRANQSIMAILENDVLLVLVYSNTCETELLQEKINKFLNDLLIYS